MSLLIFNLVRNTYGLADIACFYDFPIISEIKLCSVHLYLPLFVGKQISYLHYWCLLTYIYVQHTHIVLCFCFVFFVVLPVSLDCPYLIVPSLALICNNMLKLFWLCNSIHVPIKPSAWNYNSNPICIYLRI
jgi:hypothetical protein